GRAGRAALRSERERRTRELVRPLPRRRRGAGGDGADATGVPRARARALGRARGGDGGGGGRCGLRLPRHRRRGLAASPLRAARLRRGRATPPVREDAGVNVEPLYRLL